MKYEELVESLVACAQVILERPTDQHSPLFSCCFTTLRFGHRYTTSQSVAVQLLLTISDTRKPHPTASTSTNATDHGRIEGVHVFGCQRAHVEEGSLHGDPRQGLQLVELRGRAPVRIAFYLRLGSVAMALHLQGSEVAWKQ